MWASIKAVVPQGSILGPLLFLICVNDLSDDITSNLKLFADGTSVFSTIHESNYSAINLNSNLQMISESTFKWKMYFNLNPTKQAQEVIFTQKMIKYSHPLIKLNNFRMLPHRNTLV